ncbi:MAG: response [Rhodospirillaceae bacterium]|nr:MAG: response [Rhodospirillaceae bacterium]TAN57117.1 MAG: HD domain-containing protein [Magnetospirillum sp.]TNC97910.1 MAG: response regulator [Stygiobacter sp.]
MLALAAGVVSYVIEIRQLDRLVHQMATQQATHLVHSMERGSVEAGQAAAVDGFLFARVTTGSETRDLWRPGVPTSLRGRVDELLAQNGDGEHHVTFRQDDRLHMFIAFDLGTGNGRFAGLYRVDESLDQSLTRQVTWSVAGIILAVVLSTGILVPVLLALEGKVIRHARDAVDANIDALVTLGNAIAQRDSDTDAHNYRVTLYAIRLAEHVGLDDEAIRHLIRGAFLHDVGKIGIPDAVLLKPGKLTEEEFSVMRTHVRRGLAIVGRSRWLAPASEVIGGHHERYDGSGYPQGLSGEAIPLAARIFAVVDVFDALTSKRPYKEAFPLERARDIMFDGRGRHFDPVILDRFLEVADALYVECCIADETCARRDLEQELRKRFG